MSAAEPTERIPVWLDCDPGHDDAFAILLAAYSPALELLGISTVGGNQTLEKTTANALKIVHIAGLDHVQVVAGAPKPLLRPAKICGEIHGDSGLDGPDLLVGPRTAVDAKAVNAMYTAIAEHTGRRIVTLICTGALTNAALLLSVYPELVPHIRIVLMGGAMGIGNTGPVQEFNIQVDPEAAAVVFESGAEVTMVPLEVTHTALVTPAVLERIGAHTKFRRLMCELLLFFRDSYRRVFDFEYPPLHDPCAVAYVIAPHLFECKRYRVDIETRSALSAGQTVVDVWGQSGKAPNATVTLKMDVDAFWEMMLEAIGKADARSPLPT